MILKLSVNNQSVESSGITKDYKDALCEYVWNSFEANATAVAIDCIPNELTGSAEIVITDNGDGIAYDSLERTFGAFLDSQKNSRSLQIKTKANKGKGRFSCFSFASLAEWSTVTATPDGNIAYTISLENADKNQCDVSDPAPTTRSTGTRLIISGIDGICEDDVTFAQLEDTMLKAYSKFLDVIEKIERLFLAVAMVVMIADMTYQVILRYVFSNSNAWSEELARYLFIFEVMIAAAIAIRKNSHLQIDVLINCFKPRTKTLFTLVSTLVGIAFLVFLLVYSIGLVKTGGTNISVGLNIPMSVPYASIPIGTVLMLLTSVEVVLKSVEELKGVGAA